MANKKVKVEEAEEVDKTLSTRVGIGANLMVTVPASAINMAKTAHLISGKPAAIEVTCIISYIPDSFDGSDDEEIFL